VNVSWTFVIVGAAIGATLLETSQQHRQLGHGDGVVTKTAFPADRHQFVQSEPRQLTRNRRLRQPEGVAQFSYRLLAGRDETGDDSQPHRISQGFQYTGAVGRHFRVCQIDMVGVRDHGFVAPY
jgi:hypothetical protein